MKEVLISLGSNLGDRIYNIKKGISFLEKKGLKIKKISSFYMTSPMYYEKQPYFINAAVSVLSPYSACKTLRICLDAEKYLKRKRYVEKGPRTLDMDIIYFGTEIIKSSFLEIPHPGRLERPFVMIPLNEINPNFQDPKIKEKICRIVRNLKNNTIKIPNNPSQTDFFLNSLKPKKADSYGLKDIKDLLKVLNNPQKDIGKIIHITGSAGKTGTAFFCAQKAHKEYFLKTGLYISPHIISFRERISVNGKKISKKDFFDILIEIISKSPCELSYFELMTAAAFLYFSRNKTDLAVIEAGLGGARDATNAVDGDLCVFTPITKEHADIIGPRLKDIVLEKSGIIKIKSKVICSAKNKGKIAFWIKKKSKKTNKDFEIVEEYGKDENIILAKKALISIFGPPKIKKSFKYENMPGREEFLIYKGKKILLDGAHIPMSFERLFEKYGFFDTALVSFLKDKEIKECMEILNKNCDQIILTEGSSYRTAKAEQILDKIPHIKKIVLKKNLERAFKKALKSSSKILISGSLYFCADIKALIKNKKISHPKEMIVS